MNNLELDMLTSAGYMVCSEYDLQFSTRLKENERPERRPILMETYLDQSSLIEAIKRGEKLNGNYGAVTICQVVCLGTLERVKHTIQRGRTPVIEAPANEAREVMPPKPDALDAAAPFIDISEKAVNNASLYMYDLWTHLRETDNEGLCHWLRREAAEALRTDNIDSGDSDGAGDIPAYREGLGFHVGHYGLVLSFKYIAEKIILLVDVGPGGGAPE